ncbi:ectoine/hydroxyectoine ABC transporter permease subunit EhuD [Salinibacterium sp. dk2585]|uniref:ectoine/hydroxyectoine ABC transporter permease subunit EhuD n=1 Tax=unclassified Salinibacterium TaxID=2632331 RepID=UPI0011C2518C|nr:MULTISPECIES: ectoine/hydroxyectoine ABC transporter permease subunit EhuD [unclassified Salinibacterium]QEE61020.1 ectoine/hydroxyectoine ABC transporter permease subunit EhuD [Salinibacterium sp. dk2585]TXK52962.1 ectoine/hydroxyectoine ABC transporter permease subunit EhuD [Salinibacterium sp. dk5596]
MNWDWGYAISIMPMLLNGLLVTVVVTLIATAFGLAGGLLLGIVSSMRIPFFSKIADGYVIVFRNSPFLVQLYLIFFALPEIGIVLTPQVSGVLGLGLFISAYMAEVYRAGIASVPVGQWEATTSINLSKFHTWTRVILPQAIPPIIPMLGNYANLAFKLSAYVAVIGTVELFGTALRLGEQSYRYIEPFTLVGLLYLVVSVAATISLRQLEKRMQRNRPQMADL